MDKLTDAERKELEWWRSHKDAILLANALLQAARPLVLNMMKVEDVANHPYFTGK